MQADVPCFTDAYILLLLNFSTSGITSWALCGFTYLHSIIVLTKSLNL